MFEIGVFGFILFAIAYWTTLFVMGRREDVLHGQFVEAEPELVPAAAGVSMSFLQPISPPMRKARPAAPVVSPPAIVQAPPAPTAATSTDAEALQSLLVSIKQELKNAAQI